jgi:ferritin-like metal-binding protein YciE
MAIFGSDKLNSMEDLFWMQAADLLDAEKQLIKALPKMADAAHNPKLKEALKEHLSQTKRQAARLEEIYRTFGREPETKTCEAMKGLIAEGEEVMKAKGDPSVKDAALIAASQKVEHYEISGYGTLRTMADRLGHRQAADLLRSTLSEEKEADHLLNFIAEQRVNPDAEDRPL